ncbi:MAG: methyltransferase domain-containing protein [Syntrophotaleaceae bacterium]
MHILNAWPDYFENGHEGMGTTYERFVLHTHFQKLVRNHEIESVIEAPSFGMTGISGINSMWWSAQGIPVTVVDHNMERLKLIGQAWEEAGLSVHPAWTPEEYSRLPFGDKTFDMGWNFASLIFIENIEPILLELVRVTKKLIFFCIPNCHNPFVARRIKNHRREEGLYYENADREKIVRLMSDLGWTERGNGTLDAPPWPDIAMNKEDMLRRVGMAKLARLMEKQRESRMCILDYFSGRNRSMEHDVLRYSFLENLPEIIKKYWAHHQYFFFLPSNVINKVAS